MEVEEDKYPKIPTEFQLGRSDMMSNEKRDKAFKLL